MRRCALILSATWVLAGCPGADSKIDTGAADPAVDADADGYASTSDCDDDDPSVHPGADELCDGIDNDCDGFVDDDDPSGIGETTSWADVDGDGFGDPSAASAWCAIPSGYVADDGDCDDDDPTIHPAADELCDGVDNDCDGLVDDDDSPVVGGGAWYPDDDADGYGDPGAMVTACMQPSGHLAEAGDCDDGDASAHPGADERCDGVDNDCDGDIDEADAIDPSTFYGDVDGDGFGDPWNTSTACHASAGFVADSSDCDDGDAAINPAASEACNGYDDDCDGLVDDDDSGITGGSAWYLDGDADGYGDPGAMVAACLQPGGYLADASDCDDDDASAHPGADELCDGADNDCDGAIDEADAIDVSVFLADVDGDGFGDPSSATAACSAPRGYVAESGSGLDDCDDGDAAINPAATELCDGVDNDCDGLVDDDDAPVLGASTWYGDGDGDGYGDPGISAIACAQPAGTVGDASDCDDGDAAINPAADELCDGTDNDCDGLVDDDDAPVVGASSWYADADGDSYGDASSSTDACSAPSGAVSDATDCDDGDAAINPAADELCDGVDNDCDGATDGSDAVDGTTWYTDGDADGFGDPSSATTACTQPTGTVIPTGDCDDTDPAVFPGTAERCNGYDDDCDGLVDDDDSAISGASTWYLDADGDGFGAASTSSTATKACVRPSGYAAVATDCDDADPAVYPGAAERCNGYDDDCDGLVDDDDSGVSGTSTFYQDADQDGYGDAAVLIAACSEYSGAVSDATDCDDSDQDVNPGASEACNGVDDDCDGVVDSSAACPCDVQRYLGHVYLFCEQVADWWDARDVCLDQDSYDLVTIDGTLEQTWVHGTIGTYSSSHWWWIGYNDIDAESWEEPASAWEWADGRSHTYTNWNAGQPDDYLGAEDCAHMYGDLGTWNDMDCDRSEWYGTYLYFICESG